MKLYLASSLCYVSDIIQEHESFLWKKIWCIWNAADSRWGKNAERNQMDYKFLLSTGAKIIDIDIKKPWYNFNNLDALFVGWWDTYYLAELVFKNWYSKSIINALNLWLIYMWTSAWSRLLSKSMNFEKEWCIHKWLGIIDQVIIWHRWRPDKWVKRQKEFEKIFKRPESCILLLENEVILSDWESYTIKQSNQWKLEHIHKLHPPK